MSLIIGVNKGITSRGKRLVDGGACLIRDSTVIFATAEERVNRDNPSGNGYRMKHAGGYNAALGACLKFADISAKDIDIVVYSTCCEEFGVPVAALDSLGAKQVECSHHVSHTMSAFAASPFENALGFVADSGGTALESMRDFRWWAHSREQCSWFKLSRTSVTLVSSDFARPFDAGFGEVFRALTFFCGWHSATRAGDAMTIAAFGSPYRLGLPSPFHIEGEGHIESRLLNEDPREPTSAFQEWLFRSGINAQPRPPDRPLSADYFDLAASVQHAIVATALEKAKALTRETGIEQWCLAGGLAYNTPLVRAFRLEFGAPNVFVGPASGDHGQCLGNAVYGCFLETGNIPTLHPFSPYIGASIGAEPKEVERFFTARSRPAIFHKADTARLAKILARGEIVAVARGRSEFGPRALGNRSILASPFVPGMRRRLNRIKGRSRFMPIAPVMPWPAAQEFFEIESPSMYMADVFEVRDRHKQALGEVCHVDGSARLQCVTAASNPWLFELLHELGKSGVPCLGNTSLNGRNEPIVDNLDDLARFLESSGITFCLVGDLLVEFESMNEQRQSGREVTLTSTVPEYDEDVGALPERQHADFIRRLKHTFPDIPLSLRERFALEREFIEWVRSGRKTTTVRYVKGRVDAPGSLRLDVIPTKDFEKNYDDDRVAVDTYDVLRVCVKSFGDLDDVDGRRDGFASGDELKTVLRQIYGPITDLELVTIYHIRPVHLESERRVA